MVCDCCRNACVSKHTAQVRKQQEGVVSIRDCCSRRRTFVADDEERKNFVLVHAQGHKHQNKHTIPLLPPRPPPFCLMQTCKTALTKFPSGRGNINRKPQLLSTFLTDEEPAEPAWHVSVAMTGLI